MSIKTMQDLRTEMLRIFDDLQHGKIELAEAVTCTKISETVIAGVKAEMQYAILTNQEPAIPFFGKQSGKELSAPSKQKLLVTKSQ